MAARNVSPTPHPTTFMQIDAVEHGKAEDRADRQIDAARQHHDRQSKHDETCLGELAAEIGDVRDRIKIGKNAAEHDKDDDQRQERDGVVHPALGQQFADDVIGDVAVAETSKDVAATHEVLRMKVPRG